MQTLQSIYQWGGLVFVLFGMVYAAVGLVRGDCPFVGYRTFADSCVSRFATGVGIGMVWPIVLAVALVSLLRSVKRGRGY